MHTRVTKQIPKDALGRVVDRPTGASDRSPDFDMPADDQVDLTAETFRPSLADPAGIQVLWELLQGELSVASLAEFAGTSPTAVSQHLARLRMSRLVTARRKATFMYYSAAADHVRRQLAQGLHRVDPETSKAAAPVAAGPHLADQPA
jgi:DNA-binding transcriptional ArsR family regulator